MTTPQPELYESDHPESGGHKGHGGHGGMMIVSCVPMLAVAIILVVTGIAGLGFLIAAVMCTAMMAAMMGGFGRDSSKS